MTQTWYGDRYDCTLIGLGLDSRSQECEKAKPSAPIISQSFQFIWMEFGTLLRHVGVMNQTLPFGVKEREPNLCEKKKKKVDLYSGIYFRLLARGFGLQI